MNHALPFHGLRVFVAEDRVVRVPRRLPRTRVKTASVRKAYQRLRRRARPYESVRQSLPDGVFIIGDAVHVNARTWAELCRHLEVEVAPTVRDVVEARSRKVEAALPPARQFSTADVTVEGLLETMRRLEGQTAKGLLSRPYGWTKFETPRVFDYAPPASARPPFLLNRF